MRLSEARRRLGRCVWVTDVKEAPGEPNLFHVTSRLEGTVPIHADCIGQAPSGMELAEDLARDGFVTELCRVFGKDNVLRSLAGVER